MASTIRLVDIARLLGVSKQRVHQLASEGLLPAPVGRDSRGRLWSRQEVQAWARREWWGSRPWR
jgi:predicted DNA-binding transcriptional regulator AlpA